jgi:uncharacterized membrane protein (DUF485 family)
MITFPNLIMLLILASWVMFFIIIVLHIAAPSLMQTKIFPGLVVANFLLAIMNMILLMSWMLLKCVGMG